MTIKSEYARLSSDRAPYLQRAREDFREMILILAGGDLLQAEALKRGSVDNYISKFDLHVKRLEDI